MNKSNFVCGKCIENDAGLCDVLGIFVEDDDAPHCPYGKDFQGVDEYSKEEKE